MTIQGTIIKIGETETVGTNGFTKRLLVIESEAKFNNTIPVEFLKEKGDMLNKFALGDLVEVSINIGGREHNGKFYPSITGWKITATGPDPVTNSDEVPF